jgi:hypothetical protein
MSGLSPEPNPIPNLKLLKVGPRTGHEGIFAIRSYILKPSAALVTRENYAGFLSGILRPTKN